MEATASISLFILFEFRSRKNWNKLKLFVLGGILGGCGFIIIQLSPDPLQMIDQFRQVFEHNSDLFSLGVGFTSIYRYLVESIEFWWLHFVTSSPIGPIGTSYFVLGGIGLVLRRQYQDNLVLVSLLVALIGHTFIYRSWYHVVDITPLISLIIASLSIRAATWLTERYKVIQRFSLGMVNVLLITPLISGYVAGMVFLGWDSNINYYDRYASALQALVPADASVFGEMSLWWAFHEQPYQADDYLNINGVTDDDPDVAIRAILSDAAVDTILRDEFIGSPNIRPVPPGYEDALTGYIDANCTLIGSVEDYIASPYFGDPAKKHTQVFRCPLLDPADVVPISEDS